jgi:alkylhydroperoxidase/carboxymuconolactone decarboxylase family protein YurZ
MRDDCGKGPEGAQIAGVFLHAAVYAGMPGVNRAFAVAQQVPEAG